MKVLVLILLIVLIPGWITPLSAATDISNQEGQIKSILHTVSPSIVKVISQNHKIYFATGIAIEPDYVISNSIIIRRPYESIYIQTLENQQIPATVVGKDNKTSIVLLKIDQAVLTPIKKASHCEVGDWVALVGAFYKKFPSIFQGLLSSISEDDMILNAPVVPGVSGGAVVNRQGELVGMVRGRVGFTSNPDYTFKDYSSELSVRSPRSTVRDLCAAIPLKSVIEITNDLKKYGRVRRGWLGVGLTAVNNLVRVRNVAPDSPAAKAGIKPGDHIFKVSGKFIESWNDLSKIVKALKPEQKLELAIRRDNKEKNVIVTIGEAKEFNNPFNIVTTDDRFPELSGLPEFGESFPEVERFIFEFTGSRTLGVDVVNLTPELAKAFDVAEKSGLMISRIHRGSAAESAGLLPADIIVKAADINVNNIADLRNALKETKEDEPVTIEFYRKGIRRTLEMTPNNKEMDSIFSQFNQKLNEVMLRIDTESLPRNHKQTSEFRQQQEQEKSFPYQTKEYEKDLYDRSLKKIQEHYLQEIKRMKEEQEKMRLEMDQLKKQLLEKQNQKNTEKEDQIKKDKGTTE